jgi:F-type H+-transporting ATPase subunit gamma
MEQLPRLHARIASLAELRDLIQALRALAASHMQEAVGALDGIRRYVDVVEGAIAAVADMLPTADEQAWAPGRPDGRVLIVVCSEHGFVGAFNERLLDRAAAELRPGCALAVIGRRGMIAAEERHLATAWCLPMATHVGGVAATTRRMAGHLAGLAGADIVFARHASAGGYEVEKKTVLPLDPALLAGSQRRSPPLHQLPPEVLLQRLAGEYLFAEITRALMESLASESAARLLVMQSADRNIDDKLQSLRREENVLRQDAITSELLDVVTGALAVLETPSARSR